MAVYLPISIPTMPRGSNNRNSKASRRRKSCKKMPTNVEMGIYHLGEFCVCVVPQNPFVYSKYKMKKMITINKRKKEYSLSCFCFLVKYFLVSSVNVRWAKDLTTGNIYDI